MSALDAVNNMAGGNAAPEAPAGATETAAQPAVPQAAPPIPEGTPVAEPNGLLQGQEDKGGNPLFSPEDQAMMEAVRNGTDLPVQEQPPVQPAPTHQAPPVTPAGTEAQPQVPAQAPVAGQPPIAAQPAPAQPQGVPAWMDPGTQTAMQQLLQQQQLTAQQAQADERRKAAIKAARERLKGTLSSEDLDFTDEQVNAVVNMVADSEAAASQAAIQQVQAAVPQYIDQAVQRMQAVQQYNTQFYDQWPGIKAMEQQNPAVTGEIQHLAQIVVQANQASGMQATPAQIIQQVGQQFAVSKGIPLESLKGQQQAPQPVQQAQAQPAPQQYAQPVPSQIPYAPVRGGATTAAPTAAAQPGNVFTEIYQDWQFSEGVGPNPARQG